MPVISLKIITPATSSLLFDPADVLLRIKGKSDELDEVTRVIRRVGSMISTRLGFDLAFQEYQESFRYVDSQELQLGVSPLAALSGDKVWSPDVDTTRKVTLVEDVDFEVQKSNNVLFKPDGWGLGFIADWMLSNPNVLTSAVPDWIVQYQAGYWLPLMTGTRPDAAPLLSDDLDLAAWAQFQHLYTQGRVNPQVKGFAKAGARTDFRAAAAWHPTADAILSTRENPVI